MQHSMEELFKMKTNSIGIFEQKGFTMTELMVSMVLLAILAGTAIYSFKKTKEGIACSDIYSAFQMAKMRAISTGYNAYVDFDMDTGAVSDGFYTAYLDTDADGVFGETNNANGHNEFTESNFAMPDASGGFTGVALPSGIKFGFSSINPPTNDYQGDAITGSVLVDGVAFGAGNRASFNSKGTATAGSVYLYDENSSSGAGCAVIVSPTGIIRRWNWNGSSWN